MEFDFQNSCQNFRRVRKVKNFQLISRHLDAINAVALFENYCISASADNTLQLFDLNTKETIATLNGHTAVNFSQKIEKFIFLACTFSFNKQ